MKDENNLPSPTLSPPSPPSPTSSSKTQDEKSIDTPPIQTGGTQNYMASPSTVQSGSKSATGKIIATVLSLLILVGGVATGVFLVGRQQKMRSRASEQDCLQSENCIIIKDPEDSGSYQINGIIYDVYLTDENANIFGAGVTEDGCYRTSIDGDSLTWERVGTKSECKNLVNIQVWMIEFPQETPDPVVSQCREITIFDKGWNRLSEGDLNQVAPGDEIIISVTSTTTAGSIEQARFSINNQSQEPTILKRPDTNDLYINYIIPEGANKLEVTVELYHSTFGWF